MDHDDQLNFDAFAPAREEIMRNAQTPLTVGVTPTSVFGSCCGFPSFFTLARRELPGTGEDDFGYLKYCRPSPAV